MSLIIAAMPADDEIARMVLGCKKHADRLPGRRHSPPPWEEPHERNMGCTTTLLASGRMGAGSIIDPDGQHDASDIPKLLSPLNSGCG